MISLAFFCELLVLAPWLLTCRLPSSNMSRETHGKEDSDAGFRKMRRVKSVEPVVSLSCLLNMSHEQHRQDQVTSTGT
jgi:hypothetical protein